MALLVVWSHSFALHLGGEEREWVYRLTNGTVTAGTIGVMTFFVISGFLISQSWERSKGAAAYFGKRVRRIYPGYMAATAICAFIVVPLFSTNSHIGLVTAAKTLAHNLLLQNYFPASDAFASNPFPGAINGSLWSIPIEFWCYIMLAVLGVASLAANGRLLIAATAVMMMVLLGLELAGTVPHGGWAGELLIWLQIMPSFLLGMIVYAYRKHLPRTRAILLSLVAAAMIACWVNVPLAALIVAPALAYATFYVAFSDCINLHHVAKNGDFSYGTYLYAFPIQQIVQAELGNSIDLGSFILLSLGLSLLAGIASWHLVEKHFMRRRRKLSQPAVTVPARTRR